MIETPRGAPASTINDFRNFLDGASSADVVFEPVALPGMPAGMTALAKKLLWSEAETALQAASREKKDAEEGKVEVQLSRYNAIVVAYGAHFQGANDGTPVRVYNPNSAADIRKIEALPKSIFRTWLEAISKVSATTDEAEAEVKNDSSETEILSSASSSPSTSDSLTSQLSVAA